MTNLLVDAVTSDNLMVGANKSLTETMELFQRTAETNGFAYLTKLADHIKLAAHVPVRNVRFLSFIKMKVFCNNFLFRLVL